MKPHFLQINGSKKITKCNMTVTNWFKIQAVDFYNNGIDKLSKGYESRGSHKCLYGYIKSIIGL